ncbi:MAG: metallophosphoesterase [Erysipelotrichaceae bacterium]|nr:metallophosphoesterase [Erysipelotrichaceae bacterium]
MAMKKKTTVILIIIASLILTGAWSYLNARFINPADFEVRQVRINSEKLDGSFDGFSIVFISDMEYGSFFDQERLNKLIRRLQGLQIDVLIFGSDLFDRNYTPITEDVTILTDALSSIEAPFGKFAVLGDFDQISEARTRLTTKVLSDSQFEILNGNALQLHHGHSGFINLLGFGYSEEITDMSASYSELDPNTYTITVIHGAEFASYLPDNSSDIILSGHSHHLQINLPFAVDKEAYPHTGKITSDTTHMLAGALYLSHGLGTTGKDYRFLSDPDIIWFRLETIQP